MKIFMIGLTVCFGMLATPMASMASLGRAEAAPAKAIQQVKRTMKATRSVRTSTQRPARARSANLYKGELPKSAGCASRSKVGMFARTAFVAPVDKSPVKNGVHHKAIN